MELFKHELCGGERTFWENAPPLLLLPWYRVVAKNSALESGACFQTPGQPHRVCHFGHGAYPVGASVSSSVVNGLYLHSAQCLAHRSEYQFGVDCPRLPVINRWDRIRPSAFSALSKESCRRGSPAPFGPTPLCKSASQRMQLMGPCRRPDSGSVVEICLGPVST